MRFDTNLDLGSEGVKSFRKIEDKDGAVVDYLDVWIKGYLSTFHDVDRDGEYVEPGAFKETIERFMKNPVLLVNHINRVEMLAGSFKTVREDPKGLYVEAALSNAPTENMREIRWKVSEGHLKTLSMGGHFYYREGGRAIFKVDLYEGTLIPIPANPNALFSTRALTAEEEKSLQGSFSG